MRSNYVLILDNSPHNWGLVVCISSKRKWSVCGDISHFSFSGLRNDSETINTQAQDFPTHFRTARNRTGLSRLKIAKTLGVNRETVGRWEFGKRYPEISKLKRIYEILGVDALPHTDNDLSGRMKLFRMKMGYRMRKASSLVKKNKYWWAQMEEGKTLAAARKTSPR